MQERKKQENKQKLSSQEKPKPVEDLLLLFLTADRHQGATEMLGLVVVAVSFLTTRWGQISDEDSRPPPNAPPFLQRVEGPAQASRPRLPPLELHTRGPHVCG